MDRLADGKLKFTLKYDFAGEFAKVKTALLHISGSFEQMIEDIIDSSTQVSIGADELSKAAQNIAEGAMTQAASVQELVATTESVSQQVEENTEDAQKSATETSRVTHMMQDSREQMNQMMEAMNKITETSNEVVSIIKTIEDIADQTNLLALNASIEAARAGEAGKGFAVVASEIGSLADDSSKAANNTRDLIEISLQQIDRGSSLAQNVVQSMQDVLDAVVTRLPETVFLTHHVYPQVLAYQPEDHGDPLMQPVESGGKWLNDQLEAAFWSDDACCEVSRCGSIICRRVAGDA